jgi:hypothetical protein|nr:hypothetical protein [Methylocella tundrae]
MRLLPLTLSAHTSALVSCEEPSSKPQGSGSYGSCRFCGLKTASWQEPFHLNGDHLDHAGENIVAACVLCHLAQHLDRETIDEEATLVWIPELTQGALNALARGVHATLAVHGLPADVARAPAAGAAASEAAFAASMALRARSEKVEALLGTCSPRNLGFALLGLKPDIYSQRATLLGGLRLLPLGRFYRNGKDIYPELIAALGAPPR